MLFIHPIVLFMMSLAMAALWPLTGDASEVWKTYRMTAPFPHQEIVVSQDSNTGETTIIFTEPPASILARREQIAEEVFGDTLLGYSYEKHRIGFDGWAKDLVFSASTLTEDEIHEAVRDLTARAFGTDYKASFRFFEPQPWQKKLFYSPPRGVPNLSVSHQSLHSWLFGQSAKFVVHGAASHQATSLTELMDDGYTGLAYTFEPGLTLLVLDTGANLSDTKANLRAFTLDSDLIIGAALATRQKRLVLIGRERQVTLQAAPPLRLDAILALAAGEETDLAQSYERNLPFAGKVFAAELRESLPEPNAKVQLTEMLLGEFGEDWAPILLSRELTHTEFGHLLNITDQILKSWSLSGTIDYAEFEYGQPLTFPTSDGVMNWLARELQAPVNELTFNWNTAGYGSWVDFDETRVFSVNRTGSLPVSYLPDLGSDTGREEQNAALREAENLYWEFFASLSNPHLIRVAQYTALHQIFLTAEISATRPSPIIGKPVYDVRWSGLAKQFAEAMAKLDTLDVSAVTDPDETACAVDAKLVFNELAAEHDKLAAIWPNKPASRFGNGKQYEEQIDRIVGAIIDRRAFATPLIDRLTDLQNRYNIQVPRVNNMINDFNAKITSCQRRFSFSRCNQETLSAESSNVDAKIEMLDILEQKITELEAKLDEPIRFADALTEVTGFSELVKAAGNCIEAIDAVRGGNRPVIDAVYHTPSIVVSRSDDGWKSTGGHNIDGRTATIQSSRSVDPGSFRIDPESGRITLSTRDISKAPDVARIYERQWRTYQFGTRADKQRIEAELRAALAVPVKSAIEMSDAALGRSDMPLGAGRGLNKAWAPEQVFVGASRRTLDQVSAKSFEEFAMHHDAHIVIEKVEGVYRIFVSGSKLAEVYETPSVLTSNITLQRLADEVSQKLGPGKSVSVVSREGLSEVDALNLKQSFETQQIVAEAGANGGGNFEPPSNRNLAGFIFPNGPRRPSGGDGSRREYGKRGEPFRIFGEFRSAWKSLTRTDLNWAQAEVTPLTKARSRTGLTSSKLAAVRIDIPTEGGSRILAEIQALFSRRDATEADMTGMTGLARRNLDEAAREKSDTAVQNPNLGQILERIRADYQRELESNPSTRATLQDAEQNADFWIVELHILTVGAPGYTR